MTVAGRDMTQAQRAVREHLEGFFAGHEVSLRECPEGPVEEHVPGFRAGCVAPGPKLASWTYVSIGCWDAQHDDEHGLEFVLVGQEHDDPRHVLSLAVTAYYHCTPDPSHRLDHGLEALEQRFDDAAIEYWDPARASVA